MVDGREWTMRPGDRGYPAALAALSVPPRLDGVGALATTGPAIAIVGSRAASAAAMATAHALARHAVGRGRVVVSGGALGIDTAAHRGALAGAGVTVVVLGTGLDVAYPDRNGGLFTDVVAGGGAVVSMFGRGAPPKRWHFVARNTVIAALAEVVLVVAAEARSGSLHTAAAARRLGRRLAAVPGTAGTDDLIATGAAAVIDAATLDQVFAGATPRLPRRALDGSEAALVAALPALPDRAVRSPAALAAALGLRFAAALAMLGELERAGWVEAVADGYRRRDDA